jgi:hypothetical protein
MACNKIARLKCEIKKVPTVTELQERINLVLPAEEQIVVDGQFGESTKTAWEKAVIKRLTAEIGLPPIN